MSKPGHTSLLVEFPVRMKLSWQLEALLVEFPVRVKLSWQLEAQLCTHRPAEAHLAMAAPSVVMLSRETVETPGMRLEIGRERDGELAEGEEGRGGVCSVRCGSEGVCACVCVGGESVAASFPHMQMKAAAPS